jgi:hypothetical protein
MASHVKPSSLTFVLETLNDFQQESCNIFGNVIEKYLWSARGLNAWIG